MGGPYLKRGFSLVELLVAIAILGLGGLALFGLFMTSIQARAKSNDTTSASRLASSELERAVLSAQRDIPTGSKEAFWDNDYPISGSPQTSTSTKVGGTDFTVDLFHTTVRANTSGANRLKRIQVRVTWWNGEKQGYGKLQTLASRLVTEP